MAKEKPQADQAKTPENLPLKVVELLGDQDGKNCFVVMPFGREPAEVTWFSGWYKEVIKRGVEEAGFIPKPAFTDQGSHAITDAMLAHLAYDPMVVVDLGGMTPADESNPNVMYELGVRHAFGKPLVIIAWKGQKLPFDVNVQRAIMMDRTFLAAEANRTELTRFLQEAEKNRYHRPMDAVHASAMVQAVAGNPEQSDVIRSLAEAVKGMQGQMAALAAGSRPGPFIYAPNYDQLVAPDLRQSPQLESLNPWRAGQPPIYITTAKTIRDVLRWRPTLLSKLTSLIAPESKLRWQNFLDQAEPNQGFANWVDAARIEDLEEWVQGNGIVLAKP